MDWIVSPAVNAQVASWFGEAPAQMKACDEKDMATHCTTYHAADQTYSDNIWYWTTPTSSCLDGRTGQVRPLPAVDPGLDRDQGLSIRRDRERAERQGARPSPDSGSLGLLSLPGLWLVVAYLGSLAAMFATAFWTTDDFTGNVIRTFTTSNFDTLIHESVYRNIALRGRSGWRPR